MKFLTAADKPEWKSLCARLKAFGAKDIYFLPEYVELYAGKDGKIEAFVYEEKENIFFLPYIRRAIGSNFDMETAYGYGGPVTNSHDAEFLNEAWKQYGYLASETRLFAGFIRFHPLLDNHLSAENITGVEIQRLRHTVKLDLQKTKEEVWRGYHSNTRNKIEKARKNNVEIKHIDTREGLLQFAALYRARMREVEAGSFYFFDDAYFENIYQKLNQNYGLLMASQDNVVLGGVLVLTSDDYAHLHLSAVESSAQPLGVASLLRHEAIMRYLNKKKAFHFGGGTTNAEDDSVFKFKAGFSPERDDFWIGKILLDQNVYAAVCHQWEETNPGKVESNKNIFLKYRM